MDSINQAKFFKPPVRADHLARTRLSKQFDGGLTPLTMVSAPAGYGKSTFVSAWLDSQQHDWAWLSLSKSDDSVEVFLEYFAEAIRQKNDALDTGTLKVIQHKEVVPFEVISQQLVNTLSGLEKPFVLVLDDYHLISDQGIHTLIERILHFPIPNFHLFLITRCDPPLKIQEWRIKGWLTEIRMSELSFSRSEVTEFLSYRSIELTEEEHDKVLEVTEGWVSGLHLMTANKITTNQFRRYLKNTQRPDLHHFRIDEVVHGLDKELYILLLVLSLFDEFSPDLANHLMTGPLKIKSDARKLIDQLLTTNLFVIPLDSKGQWFRFHHLFGEELRRELHENYDPEQIREIHLRAAQWLQTHSYSERAILNYVLSGELNEAIKVFYQYRLSLLDDLSWERMAKILDLFPQSYIEQRPELVLTRAWLQIYRGDVFEMFNGLSEIRLAIDKQKIKGPLNNHLLAEWEVLRAYRLYNIDMNYEDCVKSCEFALEFLPNGHHYARGYAWIFLGGSLQVVRNAHEAINRISAGLKVTDDLTQQSHQLLIINYVHWMDGANQSLTNAAEQLIEKGVESGNYEALANGWHFKGLAAYATGELDEALEAFERFYSLRYYTITVIHFMGAVALCRIYAQLGKKDKAKEILEALQQQITALSHPFFTKLLEGVKAELDWKFGAHELAMIWARKERDIPLLPMSNCFVSQVTQVKVLLQSPLLEDIAHAEGILDELFNLSIRTNNFRYRLHLLIFKIKLMMLEGQGDHLEATIREALHLAMEQNSVMPLVELDDVVKEYVIRNFQDSEFQALLDKVIKCDVDDSEVVPVSNRELDVLQLFAENLSNQQIADRLYISLKTVKRHSGNLFKKLRVKNRREAVSIAQDLRLI